MGAFSRISGHAAARDRRWNTSARAQQLVETLPGETLDALFDGRLALTQSRAGYRFSIDALLLAHFVSVQRADKIVDLGCGNGVVALALASLHPSATITGVELQAAMVERARRNARLNDLDGRVQIVHGDARRADPPPGAGGFDVAICNPPYRGAGSGRISAGDERRIARHELNGDLGDFVGAAARLLRNKGRAALVHLALRCADVLVALRRAGVEPKRLRMVHSFEDAEASLLLVEGVKGGRAGMKVHRPLILYRPDRSYSDEAAAMIAGKRG